MAVNVNNSRQAYEKIVGFLEGRAGKCFRTGSFDVWQQLYWRALGGQRMNSSHQEIDKLEKLIRKWAEDDKVILRSSSGGSKYNFIALPGVEVAEDEDGEATTNEELAELNLALREELNYVSAARDQARQDADDWHKIADEAIRDGEAAVAERDRLQQLLNEANATISQMRAEHPMEGALQLVAEQTRRMDAAVDAEEAAKVEVERLTEELGTLRGRHSKLEETYGRVCGDRDSYLTERNEARDETRRVIKEKDGIIAGLRSEIKRFEKGEGLVASKAVAIFAQEFDECLRDFQKTPYCWDEFWQGVVDGALEKCKRHMPAEKQEVFENAMWEILKKRRRRQK